MDPKIKFRPHYTQQNFIFNVFVELDLKKNTHTNKKKKL